MTPANPDDVLPDQPDTDQDVIANVYNEHADAEYKRLGRSSRHRAEFALTAELIDEYVSSGADVLDVGSGPGRYTEHLLSRGCRVGLTDLSENSLNLFRRRVGTSFGSAVLFCRTGTAIDLAWIPANSFDAVLLMVPLYHLVTHKERIAALEEARRVLRPGGVLVVSYLSPYRLIVQAALQRAGQEVHRLADGGPVSHMGMEQHHEWPSDAHQALQEVGFEVLRTRNLEGISALAAPAEIDGQDFGSFLAMLRATCEQPDITGATLHYVCVARRGS